MILIETINTESNIKLLTKHLTKYFKDDKSKALKLMKTYKDNLFGENGLAVWLGEKSHEFFCMYFLQDIFLAKEENANRELAQVHYDIWTELDKIYVLDECDKEEFILPRGCSKTTTINVGVSCRAHCYRQSLYTIVIANRELDAVAFVEKTKQALKNPYIKYAFGDLVDAKNRTVNKVELELTNDTKIQAFSSGTSVRGVTYAKLNARPTLVILDDFISEDDILTDNAKEKILDKFYKQILEVGDSAVYRNGKKVKQATKFLILGTPLAPDDFINAIRKDIDFKVFHRSVVDFDFDDYIENNTYWQTAKKIFFNTKIKEKEKRKQMAYNYYLDNIEHMTFDVIWEKYDCFNLALKYFNNRIAFMQELMCDCQNIGDIWFKSNRIQPKEEIEQNIFLKTMLCIDPKGTRNKKKSKEDYCAMVVGSIADNDFKYVRKAILERLEYDEYIKATINLLIEFPDITHIYIEKNTYMGADVIKLEEVIQNTPELEYRDIKFINEMQRKGKDDKISTIVTSVNNGRIIFCEERVPDEFLEQLMNFRGEQYSLHDDAADVTAEFGIRIDDIEVIREVRIFDKREVL